MARARKRDDAPVTYGDLRRAMKVMVDLSFQMTLYSARGLATVMTTEADTPGRDAAEKEERVQVERLRELAQKIEDEFKLDELAEQ